MPSVLLAAAEMDGRWSAVKQRSVRGPSAVASVGVVENSGKIVFC